MGTKTPAPRTAGDYHVLGVAELNVRELDRAVEHLRKAQKLEPKTALYKKNGECVEKPTPGCKLTP